jgi:hypothetical protein
MSRQVGKMTITFTDHGHGAIVPEVHFDGVGLITPGLFERHQNHFFRAIQRAQVEQRTGISVKEQADVS